MHHKYGKTRLYLPMVVIGTMTGLSEYTTISEGAIYLGKYANGRNRPSLTSHTLTPWEGIPIGLTSTIYRIHTNSGRQSKIIFNVWIHW